MSNFPNYANHDENTNESELSLSNICNTCTDFAVRLLDGVAVLMNRMILDSSSLGGHR